LGNRWLEVVGRADMAAKYVIVRRQFKWTGAGEGAIAEAGLRKAIPEKDINGDVL